MEGEKIKSGLIREKHLSLGRLLKIMKRTLDFENNYFSMLLF